MTPIEKNDLVELQRNVNPDLSEGLVGMVVECNPDNLDVQFPVPGKDLQAQVSREDVKFLVAVAPPQDEATQS
jgi:hypothetical protein